MRNYMGYALSAALPAVRESGSRLSNRTRGTQSSEGSTGSGDPKILPIFGQRQAPHTTRDTTATALFGGLAA